MKKITVLTYVEIISSLVVAYEIKNFMFRNYLNLYEINNVIDAFEKIMSDNIIIDITDKQEDFEWLYKATNYNIKIYGVCVSLYGDYEFYEQRANQELVKWLKDNKENYSIVFC